MEIPNNVDDMLREAMSGQKLDPLPEKVEEVSRETIAPPISAEAPPKNEGAPPNSSDKPPLEKPKAEANEYGDKAEPVGKTEQLESEANEYGLETEAPKTYTKAEMDEYANRLMRERVARFERNNQQQSSQRNNNSSKLRKRVFNTMRIVIRIGSNN